MSHLSRTLGFAGGLYRDRVLTAYRGHVRRDPMARLRQRAGRDDPYAIYATLRGDGALQRTRLGTWISPSYRVCKQVLRDHRHFGARLDNTPVGEDELDLSFLDLNEPDHGRLRRIATPAFGRRRIEAYRPRVERTVHRLLDDAAGHETVDLVAAFAAPLPIAVITDLLGIPDADAGAFAHYGAVVGSALDGVSSLRHARALIRADAEMRAMFERLFVLRRREPGEDIVSAIVAAEGDERIGPDEMVPMCILLLIAGFETTVNLIGNGTLALLQHPDQWALLCAEPHRAPDAVEEILRYDPPVQRTGRVVLEPVELEGRRLEHGQWLIPLIGAANRDPETFERPDEFDLTRTVEVEHLAFSAGVHYCLGQALARLEGQVAFAALAERFGELRLAGPVRRRRAATIRGPQRLPVVLGRSPQRHVLG